MEQNSKHTMKRFMSVNAYKMHVHEIYKVDRFDRYCHYLNDRTDILLRMN